MIIVPVTAGSFSEALFQIGGANKVADAIELRLDYFPKLAESELSRMIKACEKPCICTCRSVPEGGRFSGTEAERASVLLAALRHGAHYVDVEYEMDQRLRKKVFAAARKRRAKVIVSKHCMGHTPPLRELRELLAAMAKEKAHVVKIVTKARKKSDSKAVLALFRDAGRKRIRLIAFCMGEHGKESRVLSIFLGAFATFASLAEGLESAPGQMTAHEMREKLKGRGNAGRRRND